MRKPWPTVLLRLDFDLIEIYAGNEIKVFACGKRIRIETLAAGGRQLFLAFQDTFSHMRYPTPPAIGSDHDGRLYIFVILFYFPLPVRSTGLEFCNDDCGGELRPRDGVGDGKGRTRSAITIVYSTYLRLRCRHDDRNAQTRHVSGESQMDNIIIRNGKRVRETPTS